MEAQIEGLKSKFIVEERPGSYRIECKVCGEAWALSKGAKGIGNVLHLLNHAAGHKEKK